MNRKKTFTVILCLILGFIISWKIGDLTNTLELNGEWKSAMTFRSWGTSQFVSNRNSLAHNQMDLGKWHGNQEVFYKKLFSFGHAQLKVKLVPDSYIVLTFRSKNGQSNGVRISRSKFFPSSIISSDLNGSFIGKERLGLPAITDDWQNLQLKWDKGELVLSLNSYKQSIPIKADLSEPIKFGIRGGRQSVFVESVVLTDSWGKKVIDEDFVNKRGLIFNFLFSSLVLFLINQAIFRKTGFSSEAILLNSSLLVSVLIACLFDHVYFADRYFEGVGKPDSFYEEQYSIWTKEINDSIDRTMAVKSEVRIMLIGSSQTWGEGATSESKKWSNVLQKKIDDARNDNLVFVFNAGVKNFVVKQAFQEFRKNWIRWKPDVVVVDFGNNDHRILPHTEFGKALDEFAKFIQSVGVQALFVLEPNNPETDRLIFNQGTFRPAMERVANKYSGFFLNADAYFSLRDVRDSGQIWADHVHFTDYGQELFAELIFQALKKNNLLGKLSDPADALTSRPTASGASRTHRSKRFAF